MSHIHIKTLRNNVVFTLQKSRAWGGVVVKDYATSRKVLGSIPGGVIGDFFRGIRQFHVPKVQVPMSRNLEALTSQNPLGPICL
jgi:hypothetical protein